MEVSSPLPVCWSTVVKTEAPPQNQPDLAGDVRRVVASCKSSEGISIAVVDANAIIRGGERLHNSSEKFVSVSEVMNEVRDPVSRHRMAFLPFTVEAMEPYPESLKKVIHFARATGDLQTLSDVDLKLIALTHTLEVQIHGTKHIREAPPPIHVVNAKRLPENEMPGWGSNVPNLEEWQALEQRAEDTSNANTRILPLKDITVSTTPVDGRPGARNEGHVTEQGDLGSNLRKPRRYFPKKKDINIEGKKMVASGVDASQGEHDVNSGDWLPAVSRTTHRRYLRRKARREMCGALSDKCSGEEVEESIEGNTPEEKTYAEEQSVVTSSEEMHVANEISEKKIHEGTNGDAIITSILELRLEDDSSRLAQIEEHELSSEETGIKYGNTSDDDIQSLSSEKNADGSVNDGPDNFDIASDICASVGMISVDDDSSEQSWKLRPLSESSVACVTGDFAMQNVILQMGLRLLAPEGVQIHQLHRWILKCHACYAVTAEIGRIFCPECGNGGTLRKVSVTVGENGVLQSARRPRINLRGTKFSLPFPKGGRDAIAKNPVLREDQLPNRVLYPRSNKKTNKVGEEMFTSDDIFCKPNSMKSHLRPPVGKAVSVYFGKRNPNDNHFSRAKH